MSKIQKNFLYKLFLVIFIIILYYLRIHFYVVSIDTEKFINTPNNLIESWYSIGRFSLGFYIKLFNLIPLNIKFNNIISLVLYIISITILTNDFHSKKLTNKKKSIMFLLIMTSPLLAEQYAFTLQNIEIALSYLLLIIVMKSISKAIYNQKYLYFLLTPFLIIVFGTYQSFYLMYITLSIIYYLENYNKKLELKKQIKIIATYIIILLFYAIVTNQIGYFINSFLEIEKTSYLTEQMNWLNGNFFKGILYSGYYIIEVLLGVGIDNNLGFTILIIIVIFYLKKEGKQEQLLYKLSLIILLFSPFLISIIFGTVTFNRAQFSIPIIIAYLYGKFLKEKKVYIVAIILITIQSFSTLYLFSIDLERYNNDKNLANYIEKIENKDTLPIIFIGKVNYERTVTGEVLGKSFYNWDYKTERLSNDRIREFVKTTGTTYKSPTTEQITEVINNKSKYQKLVNYDSNYTVINLEKYNINNQKN